MKKIITIVTCITGTVLEWYDFALFGAFAPIIASVFFPSKDSKGIILTFLIFFVGFVARPIGGGIFGHIGDKYGRKKSLFLCILFMTIPTVLIGCIPPFQTIGFYAPLALLFLRTVQGFVVGGEYSTAITYLYELSNNPRKSILPSFSVFGVMGGIFLGSLMGTIISHALPPHKIYTFGWRIPFIASILIGVLGFVLRKKGLESHPFQKAKERNQIKKHPLPYILKNNKTNILYVVFLFSPIVFLTYTNFVYEPAKFIHENRVNISSSMVMNTVNMLIFIIFIPTFAWITRKINKKVIISTGLCLVTLLSGPLFYLFTSEIVTLLFTTQLILTLVLAISVCQLPAFVSQLFNTPIRVTGIAIGLNFSAAIFGGTAPLLNGFIEKSHLGYHATIIYTIAISIPAIILLLFSKSISEIKEKFVLKST